MAAADVLPGVRPNVVTASVFVSIMLSGIHP